LAVAGPYLVSRGHAVPVAAAATPRTRAAAGACVLSPANPAIQHVVFVMFDNAHFYRDAARDGSTNVASDLEQMPHLLNFITGNGTLLTNHHTPLIAHTSDDIITSETGVYPARHGVATSANSYFYYKNGSPKRQSGFTYWTDLTSGSGDPSGDGQYNLLSAPNTNAPAPWVPYTRAGCDFGAVAMADMEVENTGSDLSTIFGAGSPQTTDPNAFANYEGVAIHCSQADSAGSGLCASANGGYADNLPSEPNTDGTPAPQNTNPATTSPYYTGYNALFGSKYVQQSFQALAYTQYITTDTGVPGGSGPVTITGMTDINGNPIVDDFPTGTLHPGFPGFSIRPEYALGYAADMLDAAVPVVYAYINTPHRQAQTNPYGYGFPTDCCDYGPGEAHYVQQLQQYDNAFNLFFSNLASHGIDKSNTLFVFSADEEDHVVATQPQPAGCNGVTLGGSLAAGTLSVGTGTACTYPTVPGQNTSHSSEGVGELQTNYNGLLQGEQGTTISSCASTDNTPGSATVNADDAPDIYLAGQPGDSDACARAFEQATAALTLTNPISVSLGAPATDTIAQDMANPAEFKLLHMVTADPLRTPSYTAFMQPDYFVQFGSTCPYPGSTPDTNCTQLTPGFAWNHGDVQPQITTDWLGFVGPGVANRGLLGNDPSHLGAPTFAPFTDHVDIRPTILASLGLGDDYQSDGRVLSEILSKPNSAENVTYLFLAQIYKQCYAPLGVLDQTTLQQATAALSDRSAGDPLFTNFETNAAALATARDATASQMEALLANAAFNNTRINPRTAASLEVSCALDLGSAALLDYPPFPHKASAKVSQAASARASAAPQTSSIVFGVAPALVLLGLGARARRRSRRQVV
jgi:hypothetical protein